MSSTAASFLTASSLFLIQSTLSWETPLWDRKVSAFKESWLKNTSLGMWQASWQSEVSKECYLTIQRMMKDRPFFWLLLDGDENSWKKKKLYFAKVNKNGYVVYR